MSNEVWKDIIGYEGLYKVSNKGKVYSLLSNKELSQNKTNGNGYIICTLCKNKQKKNKYVHRLVAYHFVENKNNDNIVNHIDGNLKNNNADNLEWCDQKRNVRHYIENGLKSDYGVNSPNTKLNKRDILEIRHYLKEGSITQKEIALIYDVSQTTISHINLNKRHANRAED